MICGHCKQADATIAHVKAHTQPVAAFSPMLFPLESLPVAPTKFDNGRGYEPIVAAVAKTADIKKLGQSIPNARYALVSPEGIWQFFEVRQGTPSKTGRGRDWTGHTFVDSLIGAPGDYAHYPIRKSDSRYSTIVERIAADPMQALADFGKHAKHCGKCSSGLSNIRSLMAGYGETCAEKSGYWYPSLAEAKAWAKKNNIKHDEKGGVL